MTSLNIPKTTCTELDGLEELGLKGRLSPFANQKKFLSSNPSKNCSATHCLENFLITSHTGINLRPWPHPRPLSQEKGIEVSENKSRLALEGEDSSPCKPTILKKPSLLDGFFLEKDLLSCPILMKWLEIVHRGRLNARCVWTQIKNCLHGKGYNLSAWRSQSHYANNWHDQNKLAHELTP